MKAIFFTFALLAVTNASFLRNLGDPTVGDATYSTPCTNFVGLKVTATLTDAAEVVADNSKITLEATTDSTKTVSIVCDAVEEDDTELVCQGTATPNPALAAANNGLIFKLKSFSNFTVSDQTSSVTYNAGYLALGTNADQEVDYDDDAKKTFTVVYGAAFADDATLPEIKVGTEVVTCVLNADAKTKLTCTPDGSKIKESETAYQITAKNACGTYDNVAKLTVKGSAAFLKASLALLVAVFLF